MTVAKPLIAAKVEPNVKAAFADLHVAGPIFLFVGMLTFVFSTILGWEYYGEKSLEYLIKAPIAVTIYRLFYSLVAFVGATTALQIVWDFSDTMNGLMAIPNLISLLVLSSVIAKECFDYEEKVIKPERELKKLGKNAVVEND